MLIFLLIFCIFIGLDPFQVLSGSDSFGLKKNIELKATAKPASSKLYNSPSSLNKKQRYLEQDGDQSIVSHASVKLIDGGNKFNYI